MTSFQVLELVLTFFDLKNIWPCHQGDLFRKSSRELRSIQSKIKRSSRPDAHLWFPLWCVNAPYFQCHATWILPRLPAANVTLKRSVRHYPHISNILLVVLLCTACLIYVEFWAARDGGSARRLLLWKKQKRRAAAAVASAAMLLPQVHCELTSRRHWPRLKFRALYLWFPHHQERQSPRERHKWILHRGSNFQDEGAAD